MTPYPVRSVLKYFAEDFAPPRGGDALNVDPKRARQ
jgi:hypothetical protein